MGQGYEIEHSGRLVTVFSAPNYCDQMGNKAADSDGVLLSRERS